MVLGLNPEQQRAVDFGDGALFVLAGAGSGKTRVLVQRIAQLVRRGVPPHRLLAVTFTNKAAGEMRDRLFEMLGHDAGAMWVGTFHSTCARILRRYGDHVGLSRDFTIFDDDDQVKLVGRMLKENSWAETGMARAILWRIDQAKNRGDDPGALPIRSHIDELVRRVYPLYQERLAKEDACDFNDLLLKVLELCTHPVVGPELTGRFQHVLVDEFQDTNLVQYRLVRYFVRHTENLTVVGDDDQSIYGWRGAEPRNLLDFDRDYPAAELVKLEQNYRSTSNILNAANAVIERNLERHRKRLWTDREEGEPLLWEEAVDERAEADFIARASRGLIEEEGRDAGDIAVLYRTHAQSRAVEEALRAYGLSYKVVGGTSFFARREIKDIRAYLKLVINGAADTALERIVNVPARGIGKTTVDRVRTHAKKAEISMFEACRSCGHGAVGSIGPQGRKKLGGFVALIDELREVLTAGGGVSEIIIRTVNGSGYRERLEIEDTQESRDRLENLSQLVSMAADFDEDNDGQGTLVEFEERLSLTSASDGEDGRGSMLTLMTVHASKGLEFPVIFLCGMEDGLFPSLREREDGDEREQLEEERRLAYVAMTRAKDRLILTSARQRRHWNEVRMNRPSRFLDDIPAEYLAVRERSGRRRAAAVLPPQRIQDAGGDEFDQRNGYDELVEIDAYGDVDPYCAGAPVSHASFGMGRVLRSAGEGPERKLWIEFPSAGVKQIMARFVRSES